MYKMKFVILSGAYKNAGDFLIVDRSIQLLRHVYPDCSVQIYERRFSLEENLDEINQSDALILAGGPVYSPSIYPNEIPLTADLSRIQIPIYTLGLGWFGGDSTDQLLYRQYIFTPRTRELLSRLEQDGPLTCRDWYSVRALKNNGFTRTVMTGCPAWYDLDHVRQISLRDGFRFPYRKICISDPTNPGNIPQSMELVRFIRKKYPEAKLVYVFHRGIRADAMTSEKVGAQYEALAHWLEQMGVDTQDISYSQDGFAVYNDCDLHVGMRVHAHIYNLSIRNVSVLIEEDGRGAGVNEALGLFGIKAYQNGAVPFSARRSIPARLMRFFFRKLCGPRKGNPYLLHRLDDYLFMLESSGYQMITAAFSVQQIYFENMLSHISQFEKRDGRLPESGERPLSGEGRTGLQGAGGSHEDISSDPGTGWVEGDTQ